MKARVIVLALAAIAVWASVAAASTAVTITSPAKGSKVSLKRTPYLAIAGGATFAATSAGTTRFYLRRDGCGTSNDNPHLSVTTGTDAGDGCGLILNQVGARRRRDQASFIDFPASDGMPLSLDGTKAIHGVIASDGRAGRPRRGRRHARGLVGGQPVDDRHRHRQRRARPDRDRHAGAVHDPAERRRSTARTCRHSTCACTIHGPNVYSGFVSLNGTSYVDMPSTRRA